MNDRLQSQLQFLIEIDKLKLIERQTRLLCGDHRRENDAEHSWHLALYVMILKEYADTPDIDWLKVIKLVLIHDLVEIYAGDTFIYDEKAVAEKEEKEIAAAETLFALLPPDQAQEFHDLWQEFEKCQTPESKFARIVDRMQPFLMNYTSGGGTWSRPEVTTQKVSDSMSVIFENSRTLGEFVQNAIDDAVRQGILRG